MLRSKRRSMTPSPIRPKDSSSKGATTASMPTTVSNRMTELPQFLPRNNKSKSSLPQSNSSTRWNKLIHLHTLCSSARPCPFQIRPRSIFCGGCSSSLSSQPGMSPASTVLSCLKATFVTLKLCLMQIRLAKSCEGVSKLNQLY